MKGHLEKRKLRDSVETKESKLTLKSEAHRSPFSTPTKSERKRKREREINLQKLQMETFVMKLFDRSLDLSKYTEKTPLYPICRAWIANQPRNSAVFSFLDRPACKSALKRENNGAEILKKIQQGDLISINDMPAPLNFDTAADHIENKRKDKLDLEKFDEILKTQHKEENESEEADKEENQPSKSELLQDHKQQWKQIKSKWLQHRSSCSKRYELNQLIIKKIFQP